LQLANAMRSNTTIKILDLKWNNIGLTGANALLDMLKYNRTLMVLDLDGNNINHEILTSIGKLSLN
jgi:Ran GTPase-activating protein (RanGAP) involved in mRNA processing and transport